MGELKGFTQKYSGMSQDVTLSKTQDNRYFEARNIRITATDNPTEYSITNEKGNIQILEFPIPVLNTATTSIDYTVGTITKSLSYTAGPGAIPRCQIEERFNGTFSGTQTIIGLIEARDSVIVMTTDESGYDCTWEVTGLNSGSYGIDLLYMNDLGYKKSNPIQILYNYENSVIEKIYFVDGVSQLRYMNIRQSIVNGDLLNLADMEPTAIDTVSNFELSQPQIKDVTGGGSHTSGMIQYAYGLYVLNGSQTTISPISEIVPIDKGEGLGGGSVNDNLGKAVIVDIPSLDPNYTHIRIYAIKYTSYQQDPEISVIADKEIDNYATMQYFDNGRTLFNVSIEEFLFLGSAPKIPEHIASKENRIFLFNVKEKNFTLDELDFRAYGHKVGGQAVIWENLSYNGSSVVGQDFTVDTSTYSVPKKHDAVNKDYGTYKYQANASTLGGEGKYLKYELKQGFVNKAEDKRFFKDGELYRVGIKIYNGRGQFTDPYWIADFVAPIGNLQGNYNHLKVELKPAFQEWIDAQTWADPNDKPIGFKIVRTDRELADRTIQAQGFINPMLANYATTDKNKNNEQRKGLAASPEAKKMPSLVRLFEDQEQILKCKDGWELAYQNSTDEDFADRKKKWRVECYKAETSDDWTAQTMQFNKLMQMYSPDISFGDVTVDSSQELSIIGMHREDDRNLWGAQVVPGTNTTEREIKYIGGFNRDAPITEKIKGESTHYIDKKGIFGPTDTRTTVLYNQINRSFNQAFVPVSTPKIFKIAGTPEMTERGQQFKSYNGDGRLRYANHLQELLQDQFINSSEVNSESAQTVTGCNAYGERCVTLMEGPGTFEQAKPIETIKTSSGLTDLDGIIIAELKAPDYTRYVGGYYGGFSHEAKSIARYISIGEYTDISAGSVTIESPGDTYVANFQFTKLHKTDVEADRSQTQMTEVISFPCETTIDLKNREDLSLEAWDNRWQPSFEEYHKYNTVYSQQPKLYSIEGLGFKYKQINEFDARIIASKEKIAGENIDSWTDFLENEQKDLDGKYGPINGVVNSNDEIYTLQDNAVAKISINPRVQTTASDGVTIELGTGGVIHDYQYITTTSGSLNKWSIKATPTGFYYYDLLNKSINKISTGYQNVTDQQGLHSFMINNTSDYDELVMDNPLLGKGVVTGYDPVNHDVYFTFQKSSNAFTIAFNEKSQSFTSIYDFKPSFYINKGDRMITSGVTNTNLWEHFKGAKGSFYGNTYESSLKFNVNSGSSTSVVFNNLMYKTEVTDSSGVEVPNRTLNTVRIYNEYQDSGVKTLALGQNIKKRNRTWTAQIPRNNGTRDRMKSPWAYIEFTFSNNDNEHLVLHDITVMYTQH